MKFIDKNVCGGPLPTRFGNLWEAIKELKENKIDVVISLYDPMKKEEYNFSKKKLKKIKHYSFQFNDYSIPTKDIANNILIVINKAVKENKKILIHCGAGIGRTGTILALYLKTDQNIDGYDAIELIRNFYNSCAVETIEQEKFIINF